MKEKQYDDTISKSYMVANVLMHTTFAPEQRIKYDKRL